MPALAKKQTALSFHLGEYDYQRLAHHAKRLDWDKCEIIRTALFERLNQLDEQEAFTKAQKKEKPPIAKVGKLPGDVDPIGMRVAIKTPASASSPVEKKPTETISEKLERSFRRHIDFVTGATNPIDRTMRLQTVLDEMCESGASADEANTAFKAFKEKLEVVESFKHKSIVKAPEGIPIDGDVD